MSLLHLRTFIEVCRRGSISEAARGLGMTQPAVSQHVASLEAQLGRPLFERHARGVRPTAIADDLAASLGSTLDTAEAALASVRARSAQLSGTVHIAGPADLLAEWVAPRLAPLLEAGLDLRLHPGGHDALYAMLLEDGTDLALTASRPEDASLAYAEIGFEQLLAVAAPHLVRQIAQAPSLAAALASVPHLTYDLDRPLMRSWLAANGLPSLPNLPAVTAPDLRIVRALVRAGAGWTVLPNYLCIEDLSDGRLAMIDPPVTTPRNSFYLVWAKSALRHRRVAFARQELLRALKAAA